MAVSQFPFVGCFFVVFEKTNKCAAGTGKFPFYNIVYIYISTSCFIGLVKDKDACQTNLPVVIHMLIRSEMEVSILMSIIYCLQIFNIRLK